MNLTDKLLARVKRLKTIRMHGRQPRLDPDRAASLIESLCPAEFVSLAYPLLLNRRVDPAGYQLYVPLLEGGHMTRPQLIASLTNSVEFKAPQVSETLHRCRLQLVRSLPAAEVIVDLGGSCHGRPEGAMLVMGYPHSFGSLSIVEPPREERHEIYADHCGEYPDIIQTAQGPVRYVYRSMIDLSEFPDNSVDLVYSGESIEHVTRTEARQACREAHRILRPGGSFCLDTPNRAVTCLQCPTAFINPDHKHEYTHPELAALLEEVGFVISEAKGLCLAVESVRQETFLPDECIRNEGIYDDIAASYLLYYRCEKP
jgi:SAM-dependent methyltransferase